MKKFLLFAVLCILVAANAAAWPDGEREGFLLGIHGGFSFSSVARSDYDDINGSGPVVGPIIGVGFNEYACVVFKHRFNYFSSSDSELELYITILGGDIMFFPKPEIPFFINAGLSRSIVASNTTREPPWGTIVHAGAGYFVMENIFVGADISSGHFEDDYDSNMDTASFTLSLGALWY